MIKNENEVSASDENGEITAVEQDDTGVIAAFFDILESIIIALVIVAVLFTFVFSNAQVKGDSMLDTLRESDHLLVYTFNYEPTPGDIIIISRNYSNNEGVASESAIVKRIVAVAGDTVEIKDGKVYVNGAEEHYSQSAYTTPNNFPEGVQTVPEGRVFVLGDNRPISADSRSESLGYVDKRYILGKVILRIFPFNDFQSF